MQILCLRWPQPQGHEAWCGGYFWKLSQEEKPEVKVKVSPFRTECESDSPQAFVSMLLVDVKLYSVTVNYLVQ